MYVYIMYVPYPHEKGPMGGAPYIGPRLGGGPIFEIPLYMYICCTTTIIIFLLD